MPSPTSRSRPVGRRSGGSRRSTASAPCSATRATGACLEWAQDLPDGVTLGTASVEEWRASGAPAPADRAAAVAAAHSGGVAVLDIPAEAELDDTGAHPPHRRRAGGGPRPPARAGGPVLPGDRGARARRGVGVQRGPLRRRRRRVRAHRRDRPGVGRREPPPRPARRRHRPRRLRAAHRRQHRRGHRPDQHQRVLHRPGRLVRGPRGLLRGCRPAPRAPALRRPRRAALPLQRRVQGRAAGGHRPHGVGRRRAHPRQRGGHRHLRAEPQPHPHRGCSCRLGPQPRDRDRGDRGRGPRLGHRAFRRPAALLPHGARDPRGRGPPPRRPRVLRERRRSHRRPGGAGAAHAVHRARAVRG